MMPEEYSCRGASSSIDRFRRAKRFASRRKLNIAALLSAYVTGKSRNQYKYRKIAYIYKWL